jgi:anion-transporting  ArsA/GET3 family ATPase
MNFLRLIRIRYAHDSWKSLLKPARLKHTQNILDDRRRRNEAIDLADCLEFGDKARIVAQTDAIRSALGLSSEEEMDQLLKKLENLRNELAHSQDIITGNWPEVVELAEEAEELLIKCEEAAITDEAKRKLYEARTSARK